MHLESRLHIATMDSISRKPEDLRALANLHPELAQWLQNHPPPPMPQDLPGMRAMYEAINQKALEHNTANLNIDIRVEERSVPSTESFKVPIKIYRAAASTTPGPLIIAIHGGAKIMGSMTDEEAHCRLFAAKFNATCINIGYRLAPEHKTPTMIFDCWNVMQWAAANASSIGADPRKGFILEGSSAGAQMADVLAHLARDEKLNPPLTGLLEICTSTCQYDAVPAEYAAEFLSWDQDMPGGMTKDTLRLFYNLTGAVADPAHYFNSPLLWPGGHEGLPPVLLQVHGRDFVRDSALIYERVLRESGVKTKLMVYPGVPHGFNTMFFATEVAKKHERDTMDGIAWLLSTIKA